MSANTLDSPEVRTANEPHTDELIASSPAENRKPASSLAAPKSRWRKWPWVAGLVTLAIIAAVGIPWVIESMRTVSTDDAYVNGHVTFVAPRISGQVKSVLVDDNDTVHRGDLLVELAPEPFQVQVDIAESAVTAAKADLVAAQASVRGNEGLTRSLRFGLEHAIEEVDNKIATLKLRNATLQSKRVSLDKAHADYGRNKLLVRSGAITQQGMDAYTEAWLVAQAGVQEALAAVYQARASLGLPPTLPEGNDLADVPADLNQTYSAVREAQATMMQAASALGLSDSFNKPPKQMVEDFYRRDPQGDIDRIYAAVLKDAPAVKQAEAKLLQAQHNLDEAKLNLQYCTIVAESDGVVTYRNVIPGNNVVSGQSLMSLRSIAKSVDRR